MDVKTAQRRFVSSTLQIFFKINLYTEFDASSIIFPKTLEPGQQESETFVVPWTKKKSCL